MWLSALGMQTIAEFVEQAETLPVLRRVGVNFAQGFGIAAPKPLRLVS
jgi:EAL domain-containing protein (putative c-di-GMP-specific phosphodiesterase class I)